MVKIHTNTYYILKHINGNGELSYEYDTVEAAIEGRKEAQVREIEYRKLWGFESKDPTNYLIVRVDWTSIYEINGEDHRFVSSTRSETVVQED